MDQIGGFDEGLASSGDKEWGNRAALAGHKLLYADDVVVFHPARHSFEQLRRKSIRIITGVKTLREQQHLSKQKKSSWGLLPPIITLIRRGLAKKISVLDLIKVIFVACALHYFKIREFFGFTSEDTEKKEPRIRRR